MAQAPKPMTFTYEDTTTPPKAKSKVPTNQTLMNSLVNMPVGKNFIVPTSMMKADDVRLHVQRAQKERVKYNKGGKLVTRTDTPAGGLRVYAVDVDA